MTKILFIITAFIIVLAVPIFVDAQQNPADVIGTIKTPPQISIGPEATGISTFIQRAIQILYVIGTIGFIFMFLWSALQMILNAGDKEAAGNARKRITAAIIGITLLALAFPIFKVLEAILQIKFFF